MVGSPPPLDWLTPFAQGGETIQVTELEIANELLDSPLQLEYLGAQRYRLLFDDEILIEGQVGMRLQYEPYQLTLLVRSIDAHPSTQFSITRLSPSTLFEELFERIKIIEKGKKTGVIEISMEGSEPERTRDIVTHLAEAYLRQNVERKTEEAEGMLTFVQQQIPAVKQRLDQSESTLNSYREDHAMVDLSLEAKANIEHLGDIEKQLSLLNLQRSELRQKVTERHSSFVALNEKADKLEVLKAKIETQLQTLPGTEWESVKLLRDVQVAKELYILLLNKSQELKIAKAGTVGNVYILDPAFYFKKPVKPKQLLIVAISFILGLLFSIIFTFVRRAMQHHVVAPGEIEQHLGLPVFAEISLCSAQLNFDRQLERFRKGGRSSPDAFILSHTEPTELAVESLRSLRTSLQFALMEAENNIISISGPAPGVGKSFIATNLAYLLAANGKRVLLIDADMRKGHIHLSLDLPRSPGLSELIAGNLPLEAVIHTEVFLPQLDFITTGIVPPNPAELLMSEPFADLLQQLGKMYDMVVIDTPPILAVTDGGIVARHAGTNFMVVRSDQHHINEISAALKRYQQMGARVQGAIFNGVDLSTRHYGSTGYAYQYEYK